MLPSFIIIYFALSLWLRVVSFYAGYNGIFGNFLRQLLKIYTQIKWIVWNIKKKHKQKYHGALLPVLYAWALSYFVTERPPDLIFVMIFWSYMPLVCVQSKSFLWITIIENQCLLLRISFIVYQTCSVTKFTYVQSDYISVSEN